MTSLKYVPLSTILQQQHTRLVEDVDPESAVLQADSLHIHGSRNAMVSGGNGVEIYVEEVGDRNNPTIIFIQGVTATRLIWDPQFASRNLSTKFHLVRFDVRGTGNSEKPDEISDYNRNDLMADDVHAVIKSVTPGHPTKKVVLVGWSLGSVISMGYTAKYGQSRLLGYVPVCGLIEKTSITDETNVLLGQVVTDDLSTTINGRYEFSKIWTGYYQPQLGEKTLLLFLGASSRTPVNAVLGQVGTLQTFDLYSSYRDLSIPILVIWGGSDQVLKSSEGNKFLEMGRKVRKVTYPTAGHLPQWEVTQRFNEDLTGFVERVSHGV